MPTMMQRIRGAFGAFSRRSSTTTCTPEVLAQAEAAYERLILGGGLGEGYNPTEMDLLSYGPFYHAISLLAGDLSKVPPLVYDVDPSNPKVRTLNNDHDANLINTEPSPQMGPVKFWGRFFVQYLIYSNAYAVIQHNAMGRPVRLRLMESGLVDHVLDEYGIAGYTYMAADQGWEYHDANDVIHVEETQIHETSTYGNRGQGARLINLIRNSLNVGLAIERFGYDFFNSGGRAGGVLSTPVGMKKPAQENVEKSFRQKYERLQASFQAIVLHDGVTFDPFKLQDPDKSQMTESQQQMRLTAANWWKIPPHKLGVDSSTSYNSLEQENRSYYSSTLQPRFEATRDELEIKLFRPDERKFHAIKHDVEELLRTDTASLHKLAVDGYQGGIFDRDEARMKVGMNPATADQAFLEPLNMQPVNNAEEPLREPPDAQNDQESDTDTLGASEQISGENSLKWVEMTLIDTVQRSLVAMESRLRREYRRNGAHGFAEWLATSFPDEARGTFDKITGVAIAAYAGARGCEAETVKKALFDGCLAACVAKIHKDKSIMPKKRAVSLVEGLQNVHKNDSVLQLEASGTQEV